MRGIDGPPHRAWRHAGPLLIVLLGLAACGDEEPTVRAPPSKDALERAGAEPPATELEQRGSCQVVHLLEVSGDTFPEDLPEPDAESSRSAVRLEGEQVFLLSDLAETVDVGELLAHGVTTVPEGTPLRACRLLVLHTRRFTGRARVGERIRCIGFAEDAGELQPAGSEVVSTFTYDPSTDVDPLPLALRRLGGVDPAEGPIRLRLENGGTSLQVVLGDTERRLTAGQMTMLYEGERTVQIVEKGISSTDIEWLTPPESGEVFDVVTAQDHGRVVFTTSLHAAYLGTRTRVLESAPEEDE